MYNELGHGFLESVYHEAMLIALIESRLKAVSRVPAPVWFRQRMVGNFKADILVEDAVLLELKAARALEPVHEAQLLNYLRATDIEVGLLMNFGVRRNSNAWLLITTENSRRLTQINADSFWLTGASCFL